MSLSQPRDGKHNMSERLAGAVTFLSPVLRGANLRRLSPLLLADETRNSPLKNKKTSFDGVFP